MKLSFWTATWAAATALLLIFPSATWSGEDLGEELIRSFFKNSGNHDQAAVEQTLAQGFQSIHSDGVRDRQGELDLIQSLKLGAHTLANFKTTRNGSVLVVSFSVNAPGEILGGKAVGEGSYERLAVWLDTDSGWKLISYANMAPLKD